MKTSQTRTIAAQQSATESKFEPLRRKYAKFRKMTPDERLRYVTVLNYSMFGDSKNSLLPGDSVHSERFKRLKRNGWYLIHLKSGGGCVCQVVGIHRKKILCHFINPDKNTYPDFYVNRNDIKHIFVIVSTSHNIPRHFPSEFN